MELPAPAQLWWTADELAAAGLPGVPGSKRRVNAQAQAEGWRDRAGLARRRAGRGGGWEYHWTLLPRRAQLRLIAARQEWDAPEKTGADWAEYDRLPQSVKDKARERLEAILAVEAMITGGSTASYAVAVIADMRGVSARSLWDWRKMVADVAASDRLPVLAPRHRLAKRKVRRAEITPEAYDYFKALYLRDCEPDAEPCYRDLKKMAAKHGWEIPAKRTILRRIERDFTPQMIALRRKGPRGMMQYFPAQIRDRSGLHAMEVVNADWHIWDVFVRWNGSICRVAMCAFQDVYSSKILSWRLDLAPNVFGVQLAFGDMVEKFGIPKHCVLDNGREFASKQFTGGVPTRYRFKVKEDDLLGTLPLMGVEVHWATPYHGQAKPIERAFRDLSKVVAKDIRLEGSWTGNRPEAKPESYGNSAVDIETFTRVVEEGIAEYNARIGRSSSVAAGRSFDEVFSESWERAGIVMPTEEQQRFWLMGAEKLRGERKNGALRFMGNTYWSPWMTAHAGEPLIGRFDPADLHAGLHVYSAEGAHLGLAECEDPSGFIDMERAKDTGRAKRRFRNATKAAAEAEMRMSATEAAALRDELPVEAPAPLQAKIVRPAFGGETKLMRGPKRPPLPAPSADVVDRQAAMVADFEARRAAKAAPKEAETPEARYRKCCAVLARIEAGEPVSDEERQRAEIYRESSEFRTAQRMERKFGAYFAG